ncbi:hypothetical protein [Aquabacterium sp.]|uniref:hypothetical protein n=1 Tax=Aquabacterium sp. TaxID=1872578 RepID=UPI003784F334
MSNEPAALLDLRDLIHGHLLPLAKRSGIVGDSEAIEDLAWKPSNSGELNESRKVLGLLITLAAAAFATWQEDSDGTEWTRLAHEAHLFGQFAYGYFSAKTDEAVDAKTVLAKIAANARHAPTRDAKALVLKWWADNGKGRMNKMAAAREIKRLNLVSETQETVRDWLTNA